MISEIHHAAIRVKDMEKSLAFYRDLLGMTVVVDTDLYGKELEIFCDSPGIRLRTVILQQGEKPTGMVELMTFYFPSDVKPFSSDTALPDVGGLFALSFQVDDVDVDYERLKEKGVIFLSDPRVLDVPPLGSLKVAMLRDPDGVLVELMQIL